ncbi:MAG: hypothetical protein ACXVFK_17885 [Solirubrobacteraceae bacterium]
MDKRRIADGLQGRAGRRGNLRRRRLTCTVLGALACLALLPAGASAQATRTWVSGVGDDANPCSRMAPCKTFAGAISKTASDGIIDALDPGGYGTVTITKGITLDGTGTVASVLASGVNGIIVNAPGKDVILRSLQIQGNGASECSGARGIWLIDAKSLTVEGVTIDDFGTAGVAIVPATGDTSVTLKDTKVNQGCGTGVGVSIAPGAPYAATAMLDGVTLTNLATGLSVADRGHAYLANSTLFGNGVGLLATGTGVIDSLGGNSIAGNTTNGTPTTQVSTGAGPPGPTGPTGPTGATGPAGPSGATAPASGIGKVTCRLRGQRRITCKIAQAKGTRLSVRISRAGRTVATGTGTGTVLLRARRAIRHGTYLLTVRTGGRTIRRSVRL